MSQPVIPARGQKKNAFFLIRTGQKKNNEHISTKRYTDIQLNAVTLLFVCTKDNDFLASIPLTLSIACTSENRLNVANQERCREYALPFPDIIILLVQARKIMPLHVTVKEERHHGTDDVNEWHTQTRRYTLALMLSAVVTQINQSMFYFSVCSHQAERIFNIRSAPR